MKFSGTSQRWLGVETEQRRRNARLHTLFDRGESIEPLGRFSEFIRAGVIGYAACEFDAAAATIQG